MQLGNRFWQEIRRGEQKEENKTEEQKHDPRIESENKVKTDSYSMFTSYQVSSNVYFNW